MADRILRYLIKTKFRGFDFYFIPYPADGLILLYIIVSSDTDLAYSLNSVNGPKLVIISDIISLIIKGGKPGRKPPSLVDVRWLHYAKPFLDLLRIVL